MFVAYVSQTQLAIDHHQAVTGHGLVYAHLFLISAINFTTVGIELVADSHHRTYGVLLLMLSLIIYTASLYSTAIYNRKIYRFGKKHYLFYIVLIPLFCLALWLAREQLLVQAIFLVLGYFTISHYNYVTSRKARTGA